VSKTTSFEEMGRSNIELVFELLRSRWKKEGLLFGLYSSCLDAAFDYT
jgi:hypothetical protein